MMMINWWRTFRLNGKNSANSCMMIACLNPETRDTATDDVASAVSNDDDDDGIRRSHTSSNSNPFPRAASSTSNPLPGCMPCPISRYCVYTQELGGVKWRIIAR